MKTVFLDRDGTINVDHGYVHKIEDWEFTPDAPAAIALLKSQGFTVVVVTNQSGIGRGMYSIEDARNLNDDANNLLKAYNAEVEHWLLCPHAPKDDCNCRKPKTGMVDGLFYLEDSWMVGDKSSDIEFGKNIGASTIKLPNKSDEECDADYYEKTLLDAALLITSVNAIL